MSRTIYPQDEASIELFRRSVAQTNPTACIAECLNTMSKELIGGDRRNFEFIHPPAQIPPHGRSEFFQRVLPVGAGIQPNVGGIRIFTSVTSVRGNNNTIRGALIHDNGWSAPSGAGIYVGDDNQRIYNNIVYHNNGIGIAVQYKSPVNPVVFNNAVYDNNVGIFVSSTTSGATIKNNIVYQNSAGNIVNNGTGTVQSNNLTTDPKFVNPSTKDFHLQTGSAAIDAGTDLLSQGLTVDFAGDARPQGCCFDIGAYEYGSSVAQPPPAPSILTVSP